MKNGGIYHFLFGYLSVYADGPFTERLINICMHRDMSIWEVKRCGNNRVSFKTDIVSYKKIKTPAHRTKSHIHITKRHGLPFIIQRFRHRYFAIIGIIIVTILLWYASTHIMGITIFGNSRIPTDQITSALNDCGLSLGCKTSDVVPDRIRNQMMTRLPDLAWIGINGNGSRMYIEIVERLEKDIGIEKNGIASNLIASRDGEIELLEIREGKTIVTPGSGVRKGDLLVSGIIDAETSGLRLVQARGEVFAKTTYEKTRTYPLEYTEAIPTGKTKTRYSVSVLNRELPLFFFKKAPYEQYNYTEQTNEYRIPVDIFPSLFIKKEEFTEHINEDKKRSPSDAVELGSRELINELKEELDDEVEILNENCTYTLNEHGEVEVTAILSCREDIAEPSVIETIE